MCPPSTVFYRCKVTFLTKHQFSSINPAFRRILSSKNSNGTFFLNTYSSLDFDIFYFKNSYLRISFSIVFNHNQYFELFLFIILGGEILVLLFSGGKFFIELRELRSLNLKNMHPWMWPIFYGIICWDQFCTVISGVSLT